jgi:hypothetical protein
MTNFIKYDGRMMPVAQVIKLKAEKKEVLTKEEVPEKEVLTKEEVQETSKKAK